MDVGADQHAAQRHGNGQGEEDHLGAAIRLAGARRVRLRRGCRSVGLCHGGEPAPSQALNKAYPGGPRNDRLMGFGGSGRGRQGQHGAVSP